MKTTFRLIGAVATVAALFSSCKKEAFNEEVKPGTVEMTIIASADDATRTVLGSDGAVTWSAREEQLAVMEVAKGTETTTAKKASNVGVTTDEGATMTFGVSMNSKTADSFDYYALYPNSAYVDKPTDLSKVKVELASTQNPTESSFGPSADVLVAKPETGLSKQPTELNLQFARVIAVGKMTIKELNTTENVKKVTFTAAGKAVTGRSYINFKTAAGVEYGYSSYGEDNVVLDYSNKTIAANGMTAYFTCWTFELAAGETFSVVVETENYIFTKDVTLEAGQSLAFNVGSASAFSVSFSGIEGVEKAPATQLVPDGAYVVAYGENMMTVGTTSNSYRGVAALPETANEDGSYSVDATAAWNFVYDSSTGTYQIYSASDNSLYLQHPDLEKTDFKLVAKESATSFTITKNEVDGSFRIINDTRCIGYNYNSGNPRFAMYSSTATSQYVDLNLYPAKVAILPKISVQETLEVPSAETESSFPVTLTNVETAEVTVYKDAACTTVTVEDDWITANFNADKTAVEYVVMENTGETRNAYIKIYAQGTDAAEATAIVTVTQAAAGAGEAVVKTYRHVFTAKPSTGNNVTLSGVSWNITATNLNGYNSTYYAGVQFGTSNANGQITLTSPSAWSYTADGVTVTKIKEVRLWLNLGGTSVTPSVSIGGKAANSDGTTVTKNSTAKTDWTKTTKVTFTPVAGSDTGVIVIDVTSVLAGYICAIEIDAE